MKNRKIVVVAFMLVAVLTLGVGYAALTDTLSLTGYANVGIEGATADFDSKIYFSSAEATSSTGTSATADTASVSTTDADVASFSINKLALSGQYSIFTFTVKNESEFDATIAVTQQATANTGYFTTVVEFPNGTTVAAGGTLSFTVKTTLIENVTETVTANTTIKLSATTVDSTTTD